MKGKWKVSSNYLGGGVVYQVYRTIREGEVDHSGNREYFPGLYDTKAMAQEMADRLNAAEEFRNEAQD